MKRLYGCEVISPSCDTPRYYNINMSQSIENIKTEYFGSNRSHNYIKDDFIKVLRGTIVRSILIELFIELNKDRHNKRELPEGGIAFGDFDPDNAGFFANIFDTYQKGWMLDVRMFLGGKKNKEGNREKGSGGKFIDDISKLSTDDFINYYIQPEKIITPPFLFRKLVAENPDNKLEFVEKNRTDIGTVVDELTKKARSFQSKGYFNKIIKEYESLEFHKDNRPDKYNLRDEPGEFPFGNGTIIVRSPKSTIAIKEIAACLNDFAEVITYFQALVGDKTDFISTGWPLDAFIDRTFALYAKEVSQATKDKIGNDVIKYLHESIDLVHWDHKNLIKNKSKKA